jgi:hypothetical protein
MTEAPREPSPSPSSSSKPTAADVPLVSAVESPSSPPVRFGGAIGIAGSMIGLVILLIGCGGYSKVLAFSVVPAAMGVFGLLIVLVGAIAQQKRLGEDTHVLQALFANLMSLVGGVLLMALWLKWPIFK